MLHYRILAPHYATDSSRRGRIPALPEQILALYEGGKCWHARPAHPFMLSSWLVGGEGFMACHAWQCQQAYVYFPPFGVGCMVANIFSRLRLILKENVGGGENWQIFVIQAVTHCSCFSSWTIVLLRFDPSGAFKERKMKNVSQVWKFYQVPPVCLCVCARTCLSCPESPSCWGMMCVDRGKIQIGCSKASWIQPRTGPICRDWAKGNFK